MEEAGFGSVAAAPAAARILEAVATDTVPVARTVDEIEQVVRAAVDEAADETADAGADAEVGE